MVTQAEAPAAEPVSTPPVETVAEPILASPPATATEPTPVPIATAPVPPTETPVASVPLAAPAVPPEVQQYITKLEQQHQEEQRLSETRILEEATGKYAQQLAEQAAAELGLEVQQVLPFVQKIAKERGDLLYQQYTAERFRQGQINAAFAIGKEFGVDPRILITLSTPDAMREVAKNATSSGRLEAENAALKAENAKLKKGSVPAQSLETGVVGGDGTRPTKDNIDVLYAKDPNRYGNIYRAFLRTGQI